MIPTRRLWIGVAISGAVLVVGFDVVVVASCCWTSLRRSRKQKPKTKTNGSGNGCASPDLRSALKRKSLVLGVVWRAIDWLRGESEDGQEDFFREDRKSLSGAEDGDEDSACQTKVLFFPDDGIPCQDFHASRAGCPRSNCPFLHEVTAYQQLLDLLRSAQVSLDVCVFCITCADLVSALIDRQKNGNVVVRVITDSEQLRITGSQIGKLRNEGVRVRHDHTSYLMHHKFAIIDGETVMNGSFNWTRTAITGNHENLVISKEKYLVRAFSQEFETLWNKFHPKHQKGFSEKPARDTWVTADYMR